MGKVFVGLGCGIMLLGEVAAASPQNLATQANVAMAATAPTSAAQPLPAVTHGPRVPVLSPTALQAAKLQVRSVNNSGVATSQALSAPLTLDTSHLSASVGAVAATLWLMDTKNVLPDGSLFAANSTLFVSYTGLTPGAVYLLDCSMQTLRETTTNATFYLTLGQSKVGTGTQATTQDGHLLYGFQAPTSLAANQAVGALVGNLASSAQFSGCTLYPVS